MTPPLTPAGIPRERPRGRLVVLCGIDGSGKATQADLLARRAGEGGGRVKVLSFPRYGEGFFGTLIERYLRGEFGKRAADVNPYLAALPYACDRWEAAPLLRSWLAEGLLVVCNRYVADNQAHQGAKLCSPEERAAFYEWVEKLEYGVFQLPRPDLQVLLNVPPTVARVLLSRRAGHNGAAHPDIHERDLLYMEATAAAYHELAARSVERWSIIECAQEGQMLPPGAISERIWPEVRKVLYDVT